MNQNFVRQFINIMVFSVVLITNSPLMWTILGTPDVGTIANSFTPTFNQLGQFNYFLPANYVFAIWAVIYSGLAAFVIYQAIPAQRNNPLIQERIGWWFALNGVFNSAWIIAWLYGQFALSMVIMLGILVTLTIIIVRIGVGTTPVSRREFWLVHAPFSIYFAWINVATIANAAQLGAYTNWDGFGITDVTWTAIMMGVAALLAVVMLVTRRSIIYGSVVVWAITGIAQRFSDEQALLLTGVVGSLIVAALIVFRAVEHLRGNRGNITTKDLRLQAA
jgi:translocator protein